MARGERWRLVVHRRCAGAALQVSSLGNVRDAVTKQPLPVVRTTAGYGFVRWRNADGVRASCCVHQLVAQAFLTPPESAATLTVVFRNENRMDCRVRNLRWAERGLIIRNRSLSDEQVLSIRRMAPIHTKTEIAKRFGVCRETVHDLLAGRTYRHV